jgi:chromate transporter
LRKSEWLGHFLDGVNAASLGLMAVVTWQLARSALVDLPAVSVGVVSGLLVFFTEINTTLIILGGVIYGLIRFLLI